jgi:hypothetical protein
MGKVKTCSVYTRFCKLTLLLVFFADFVLATSPAFAQDCSQQAVATQSTPLWDRPPQFVTGQGWISGQQIGTLSPDVPIYICSEQSVGFGYSTQRWLYIAYWNNQWWYAWVLSDYIRLGENERPSEKVTLALFPQAFAQPVEGAPAPVPRAAPQPPPSATVPPTLPHVQPQEAASAGSAALILYGSAFIVMVIGMIAKVTFDILNSKEKSPWRLKDFLLPIMVSPLVYYSLFQIVNVQVTQTGFIGMLLLAFQNGFFWQSTMDSLSGRVVRQAS